MRYLDSGSRDASQALGTWFQAENPADVTAFRWQTGYFGIDGLSPLLPILDQLKKVNFPVHAVVGSNDKQTLQVDLEMLLGILGTPRSNAKAVVVSYSRGLFHPKVYHVSRSDGSQAAYVGSANLTYSGATSLNVEAGILLDTRDGDAAGVLNEIAQGIDAWMDSTRPGANLLNSVADISSLVTNGIVGTAPKPRLSETGGGGGDAGTAPQPSLSQLLKATRLKKPATPAAPTAPSVTVLPVVTRSPPYPGYILFAPAATTPMIGVSAMTGSTLPSGASGLVMRLNRDSARHFQGRAGTANISVPVSTLSTIRFGIFSGKYDRPRAEFRLRCRYIYSGGQFVSDAAGTGIMVYGFAPGESGNGDVRMVVPAAPARAIRKFASENGSYIPSDGDTFLLEWPTNADPEFKLTCFESSVPQYSSANTMLNAAVASGNVVGNSSCWMPTGYAPTW